MGNREDLSPKTKVPTRFQMPSPGFHRYWYQGNGKKQLAKLDHIPNSEEIENQTGLLWEYDALADEVVQDIFVKMGFRAGGMLLEKVLNEGINSVPEAPPSLKRMFAEIEPTPEWVDWDLLETGAAFCRRTGAFSLLVLRNYCLMGGYESAAINKALVFTGALKKGAAKRMAETIEFWVDVTGENTLNRFEIGFKSAIKVRLMHAYARVSILKMPDWENEKWGIPINTWDMVATNLGFTLPFLDGLRNLGFRPSQKEVNGLFHLWKYLGFLMGIPLQHLANTEKEAIASLYQWTISQPPGDADTQALAEALMNEPLTASFPKYGWQKKLLINTHLGYSFFFLGKESCQSMGLPETFFRHFPTLHGFFNRINESLISKSKMLRQRSLRMGRKRQEKIKSLFLKGHASLKKRNPAQKKS